MSAYFFGYGSALNIMRHFNKQVMVAHKVEVDLRESSCDLGGLQQSGWLGWLGGHAHLIVDSPRNRHHNSQVESHTWGFHCHFWPALKLTDNIYLSTPEFLFLQAANQLDELALVFLGCEICGRYGFDDTGQVVEHGRISDKTRIADFLGQHATTRGASKALRALEKVLEDSASPMETELALRLSLPCKLGGRGIATPKLNHTIPLGRLATMAYGRDSITPDLLWERPRLAMEYESDEFHTGADRITTDSRRRLALETAGYDVVTVTNAQMRSLRDFDAIAEHVAMKTRKRRVHLSDSTITKQALLASNLHRLATHSEALLCE